MNPSTDTFAYLDKKLGDQDPIRVETRESVFQPTSTTTLLLHAARMRGNPDAASALDLGCGSGIVAVVLGKRVLPKAQVHASDISEKAVDLAKYNAELAGLEIDCRCGSTFEPWEGMTFDLIMDDVAGVSEPIARRSGWYPPQIHSDAGRDGARWIVPILSQAAEFLNPGGQLFFPALTLSNEAKILETARAHFNEVELVAEQWYPLGKELLDHMDLIEELEAEGNVEVRRRGSRLLWATKVYLATNSQ